MSHLSAFYEALLTFRRNLAWRRAERKRPWRCGDLTARIADLYRQKPIQQPTDAAAGQAHEATR